MSVEVERQRRPGIGERALDTVTGRVGIVQDILNYEDPSKPRYPRPVAVRTAFLRPVGGGMEWAVLPKNLEFPKDSSRRP